MPGAIRESFGDAPVCRCQISRDYAGSSPIARASGTRRVVPARFTRNNRLAGAIYQWAFASLTVSPGVRAFYDGHCPPGAPATPLSEHFGTGVRSGGSMCVGGLRRAEHGHAEVAWCGARLPRR